jgi:hypothetical protein
MFQDRYGLALSTSSEAAAAAYRDGIDLMLSGLARRGGSLGRRHCSGPRIRPGPCGSRAHALHLRGRSLAERP